MANGNDGAREGSAEPHLFTDKNDMGSVLCLLLKDLIYVQFVEGPELARVTGWMRTIMNDVGVGARSHAGWEAVCQLAAVAAMSDIEYALEDSRALTLAAWVRSLFVEMPVGV